MKKKSAFITNPIVYIIFFTAGTVIFIIASLKVKVPVYFSCTGVVNVADDKAFIVIEDEIPVSESVFYYINRDDRFESAGEYSTEYRGYEIDNVMNLESNTTVNVDIQLETITLLEAVFERVGKLQ